jgi:hypothetical protein
MANKKLAFNPDKPQTKMKPITTPDGIYVTVGVYFKEWKKLGMDKPQEERIYMGSAGGNIKRTLKQVREIIEELKKEVGD